MTLLDTRLDALLEQRKVKGRFRMLREYDTSGQSSMVDFVSGSPINATTAELDVLFTVLKRLSLHDQLTNIPQ